MMSRQITQLCQSSELADLKLYRFGSSHFTADNPDRPILSAHYTLYYIAGGEGRVRIGSGTYPIAPSSVFIVFPNQARQFLPNAEDMLILHWVELEGRVLPAELRRLNLTPNNPILPMNIPVTNSRTSRAFSQLSISRRQSEATQISLCWEIIAALQDEADVPQEQLNGNSGHQYVEQAVDIIRCNYMQDLTVEDIARQCRLNRSYLGKLFREETGKSTQEYLIAYRMEMACRYLRETTAPIGTVALSVGYPNQLHFSRAFRKAFGLSPREWQKDHRIHQAEGEER